MPARPSNCRFDATLARLKPWLESARHRKVGQHLKYDRHVFANHGIELRGIADDTLLESYVLESDKSHDLGALASRHLGLKTISYDDVTGKGAGPDFLRRGRRSSKRRRLRRRGCRRDPARASGAGAAPRSKSRVWSGSTATSSCRWPKCCSAWNATAC